MPVATRCSLLVIIFSVILAQTLRAQDKAGAKPEPTASPTAHIKVPDGFTVELVAGPELVQHPVMAGFDHRGRLFVAANAGVNLKKAELEKQKPNFVKMLQDTNGDGVFDKATVFADRMTFPQGALWHQGALYVASPPGIWKLEDTDNDGVADKRQMIVGGFEYTGNAADVHGPFLHPGGRLYFCHGRKGHEVKRKDGTLVSKGKGARIWSCKPDGSDIQVHAGGGMDNPTELCFTREGEILGTVPLLYANPRRDALVHWVYGGVYPREEQQAVINEFKWTGGLLGHIVDLGHTAPSGVMRYRSEHFGKEYTDNIFLCEFNTQRVMRVVLKRFGSTYTGKAEPFVTSTRPDVHFTDVLEDADGSLLVIDTGGWFRIGCPTSKIAKPNIKGAIYRIRRTEGKQYADPRGNNINWGKLKFEPDKIAHLLTDERFAVRHRVVAEIRDAIRLIRKRAKERDDSTTSAFGHFIYLIFNHFPSVADLDSPIDQQRVIWARVRMGFSSLDGLRNTRGMTKTTAARASGINYSNTPNRQPVPKDLTRLTRMFESGGPSTRLAAAETFSQIGERFPVPELLQSLTLPDTDRPLEHAIIYALIQINDPRTTAKGLADPSPAVRRGALIALDQMDRGKLEAQQVAAQLTDADPPLQQAAISIITRRGWVDAIQTQLGDWLKPQNWDPENAQTVAGVLGAFIEKPNVQQLMGQALSDDTAPAALRVTLLDVIASSGLRSAPESWTDPLKKALQNKDAETLISASRAIESLSGPGMFDDQLLGISLDDKHSHAVRLASLSAVSAGQLSQTLFKFLLDRIADQDATLQNMEAARVLSTAKLTEEQLRTLTSPVKDASALTLPILIGAYAQSKNAETGQALLDALKNSASKTALRPDQIILALKNQPETIQKKALALLGNTKQQTEQQQHRLDQLLEFIPKGDAKNGKRIFNSTRVSCNVCHRIGTAGGQVGPDLSQIGRIRQPRDLLESIVFPNASIARGYESYAITTDDGSQHVGVMRRESAKALYLTNATQSQIRINRTDILQIQGTAFSIMPQGLDKALSPRELADLVAYLMQQK